VSGGKFIPSLDDIEAADIHRTSEDRTPNSVAKEITAAPPVPAGAKRQINVKLPQPELFKLDFVKRNTGNSIQDLCEKWILDGIARSIAEIDRREQRAKQGPKK
jgi:hypothetical protein